MLYADIKTLIEKELNGDSLTLDEWERYNQWTFVEFPENLLSRLEKILADEQLEPLQDWKIWERELFLKGQALNRYFRRIAWYDKLEGFSNAKTE